jgi:DNA polymerase III subunit chi
MPLVKTIRVDFYVLDAAGQAARQHFACRLAEKAYRRDHRVHMHAGSSAAAAELDELLWTFRQGSFVPHEVLSVRCEASSPVTIGHDSECAPEADLLINLDEAVPGCTGAFDRVAEIIDDSAEGRRLGRERYRQYQQQGVEPATHTIGNSP